MSIRGRCVIAISHETRDTLKKMGATPNGISYDSILNTIILDNETVINKYRNCKNKNEKLQDAVIKLATKAD